MPYRHLGFMLRHEPQDAFHINSHCLFIVYGGVWYIVGTLQTGASTHSFDQGVGFNATITELTRLGQIDILNINNQDDFEMYEFGRAVDEAYKKGGVPCSKVGCEPGILLHKGRRYAEIVSPQRK